jgi:hypothetical protein
MPLQETGFLVPPGAIVNQIQTLLSERYKEGFPIIKEILQNANDGGATRLDIGVTSGLKDNSLHPQLQQPALFFVNNGSFRDEDSQAIGWIGVDFNAGNSSKIGKFGLGQKSVFHFCEAFFYIASSKQLSATSASHRFLTPWADGSPMSDSDKLAIENYLKTIFLKQENNYLEYFILWLPLRSSSQPRCILPNIYDCHTIQEHFSDDSSIKIGKLLPLLNSLESIHYWTPDIDNNLIESFEVNIENSQERFSYPKLGGKFCQGNLRQHLSGSIQVAGSTKIFYAGIEATLTEDAFYALMTNVPGNYNDQDDFWSTLSNLANWPKRSTYDQTGNHKVVPDKAVPHCGAVFLRYHSEKDQLSSNLTLQWAVFLPLEETQANNLAHEEIPVDSDYEYTLVLHGYFFLDSGRRSIEGLTQIYNGQLNTGEPKNKDEMIQQWNLVLATEGTLSKILLALEVFSQSPDIKDPDITCICSGLLKSKLFQQQLLHQYLYQCGYWIYQVQPNFTQWKLISSHDRILVLPDIPNWKIWSELENITAHVCLILKNKPNLLPSHKPDQWSDDEIIRTLTALDIIQVFQDPNELNFFVNWLGIVANNTELSDDVQNHLQEKIKTILTKLDWTDFREGTKISFFTSVLAKINKLRWFCLDASDKPLKYLNDAQDRVLLLPQYLSPKGSSHILSGYNAGILISELMKYEINDPKADLINSIVYQIVQAVSENERSIFCEQVENIPFISGYNCRRHEIKFYSLNEIKNFDDFIFKESDKTGKLEDRLANVLQNALVDQDIILIDLRLAENLCKDLKKCDLETCFRILAQRPPLASPGKRIDLLKRLLNSNDIDIQALRFLLHGDLKHYEDKNSLYIASQSNLVWSKVASFILDAWRTVPQELAEAIPQDQWERLKISSISPKSLIQDLDPSKFNAQNFSPEERQEILRQVSGYGTRELWRSLPLHTAVNGETVAITDNTYRSNPRFCVPLTLEHYVVLIEQTNRPEWIELWEPKAAISTILNLSNPDQYCNLLLDLIPQVPDLDRSENTLLDDLKKIPWLQLETRETVEPNRVVLLRELLAPFKNGLKEVFIRENSCSYVSPVMLEENIQSHQSLKIVCLTWTDTDVFRFLLKETQKPSNHVLLLLDILTTLENKKQTPSNEILKLLKKTEWLVDSEGQPRSPEQIIHLPMLEDTVTKILSESKPQRYISPSMLREDINLSRNLLIPKWFKFISGEDAFEKLGEILANQPTYYLGDLRNLGKARDLENELYSILGDCEQTFILKLASQDLDAFDAFIFEQVLKPINDDNKIIKILNYIIENNAKPNKTTIKIFNLYLEVACELDEFKSSILPNIKLLDQNQKWKSPGYLCDGSNNHNIDLEYLLDSGQRNIISSYLNELPLDSSVTQSSSSLDLNAIDTGNHISDNSKKLEEYFKPWLQYVPSQAIGGIILLVAGSDKNILQLAQSFLQRWPVEDLRRELLFGGERRSKTFSIHINEGTTQTVQSILGKVFEACVSDFKNVETIFLGTIDSSISLRRIDLQQLDKEKVRNLLFRSFQQLMRSLDPQGYDLNMPRIKNVWDRLNTSEELEVEVAKDFILLNSKHLLRSLGIRNSQIVKQLKLWDDKDFALSDWRRKSHRNQGDHDKLDQDIAAIQSSIENLIQAEESQPEILLAVRKKIGEGQYGYHEGNIPFEIFQNADDAVQERETLYGTIQPEHQYLGAFHLGDEYKYSPDLR